MNSHYDVVIVGSGAGGGTVAAELSRLCSQGKRVAVFEKGPRIRDDAFSGQELDMATALYEDGGGFLTHEGTMTLAFGRAYGGSTVVYTGTSLVAPRHVIEDWSVPGLTWSDLAVRSAKYMEQNNVHALDDAAINDNNRLFVEGARKAGFQPEQFPLNVKGCLGASLCNLGCPNLAKQGTHRVQLPFAERNGVEVVTRAEVLRIEERALVVRVSGSVAEDKGLPGEWPPGEYRVSADTIVLAGGSIGTAALMLRSGLGARLPMLGRRFTAHPALILVAEHAHEITNDVGHPKSFYVDRAREEGYVLETCMYFPFTTAKNLTGFGQEHSRMMRAFARLQMILVLACDRAIPQNRITIDRDGKPVVHYRFTRETVQSLTSATRAAARIFFAAGAERVHAPMAKPHIIEARELSEVGNGSGEAHLWLHHLRSHSGKEGGELSAVTPISPATTDVLNERISERYFIEGTTTVSAAHLMGGCAMGANATNSVTDSWGRVHGIPWLHVADSSLFPDSLEINPYLTIMSLADRVAEKILHP